MTITLGGPYSLVILASLCAIPLVLIFLFILYKLKVFGISKRDQPVLLERTNEVTTGASDESLNQKTPTSFFSRNKLSISGGAFLLASLCCLMMLPFSFILALGMGMGAGSGQSVPGPSVYLSIIGFLLNIAIVMAAGIIGIILLIVWAVRKFTASTN
jgi:maltodextrin utilization protein YvdJ